MIALLLLLLNLLRTPIRNSRSSSVVKTKRMQPTQPIPPTLQIQQTPQIPLNAKALTYRQAVHIATRWKPWFTKRHQEGRLLFGGLASSHRGGDDGDCVGCLSTRPIAV